MAIRFTRRLAGIAFLSIAACAQTYPSKPGGH